MNREDILKKLNEIFINELNNKSIILSEDTTASDIEEWDSINHIMLIVNIEQEFVIRFTASETQNFKHVGEMIESIMKKIN
jgi:acyl carrier protein